MRFILYFTLLLYPISIWGQDNIALVGSKTEVKAFKSDINRMGIYETTFELHDRIIIVQAELNGIHGKYILDTGAPMLMLNQFPNDSDIEVGGVAKNCEAELVEVKEFKWAGIKQKSVEAMAFDMTDLEQTLGVKIDGLIGQNIFSNFELYLDLSNQKLQLFKTRRSILHKTQRYTQKISFSMEKHIPVITVKIDGKKYRFGIDTGAEVNVLNQELKDKLGNEMFLNLEKSNLHGIDGVAQRVDAALLSNFKIKKYSFENFKFLFMDFSALKENFDLELDGILGYPFLKENIISINYHKQKIYFWK